jgi:hypothetical protein
MEFLERLKNVFKENDIEIIVYTNPKSYIKYKCKKCGQIYSAQQAVALLSKVTLCKNCWNPFTRWNIERLEEYKLKRLFPESDLSFIEFNGYKKKGQIKCNKCGAIKQYNSLPAILRKYNDKFCDNCENIKDKTYQYLINNISDEFQLLQWNGAAEKSTFLCKTCHKTFTRRIRLDSEINYCPYHTQNCNKYTLQEAQKQFNQMYGNDYTILKYGGQKGKSLLKHKCGFCFTCSIDSFYKNKGCPKCFKTISKLEQSIEKVLKDNNYYYEKQKRFDNFKKFPFDFIVELNEQLIAIEAQGRQHYENVPIFDDLEIQQKRDNKKREYCLANNIPLIEVPYWEQNNIEKFLLNKFNDYLEKE